MTLPTLPGRRDLSAGAAEAWRPPCFTPPFTRRARLAAALRRFLDLQAASIWRDLAVLLPGCRGTVLDVGCGAQPYRPLLSPEATYVGLDTADARDHFGYELPGTIYFRGDAWPAADGAADVVLCTETLEHVPTPARFLAEAFRCLRPGGQLVLTVPFAARWHFIPHDYWRFTPSALARLLAEAGFGGVAVYARGNALTVACYKVMALLLRLLMPQGRRPLVAAGLCLLGLPTLPLLLALACVAHLSLRSAGGNDCLGYTAVASKPV
jgi:SAM-dependent methyltransferase